MQSVYRIEQDRIFEHSGKEGRVGKQPRHATVAFSVWTEASSAETQMQSDGFTSAIKRCCLVFLFSIEQSYFSLNCLSAAHVCVRNKEQKKCMHFLPACNT